jgi:hypothetical protein
MKQMVEGITTNGPGVPLSARASIRFNPKCDSNEIDENDLHLQNMMNKESQHFVESQLIEVSLLKMQMIRFVSILHLIQRKSAKACHNLKNMMNREFQWFEGFQHLMN